MTDFLSQLAARVHDPQIFVRPRLPARFEASAPDPAATALFDPTPPKPAPTAMEFEATVITERLHEDDDARGPRAPGRTEPDAAAREPSPTAPASEVERAEAAPARRA